MSAHTHDPGPIPELSVHLTPSRRNICAGFNVSDTLIDSVGQHRHHLCSMGPIVQGERRQDLAQMEEAWDGGRLERPGEKSMKQGKSTCKGAGV